MTSEIRANTLKNRVGLGTVSFTNTGPVVSGIVTANTFRLPDSTSGSLGRVQFGNGLHLSMYHDGNNSFLVNNNGYLSIQSQDGVNGIFIARNAEVNLYHGSSVRLQTSSSGVTINRDLDVDGHTNLDNVSVAGVSTITGVCYPQNGIRVPDDIYSYFGTGNDLSIRHDAAGGNHSYIFHHGTGAFKLASDTQMILGETSNRNYIQMNPNSDVKLYFNNGEKLATAGHGINITGGFVATGDCSIADKITHAGDENTSIRFPGNDNISFETGGTERLRINSSGLLVPDGSASSNYISVGASQDLKLYHDGSHSYIRDTGTGGLRITTNSFNVLNSANNESMITATEDGAVKLYYNHNLRLETEGSRTLIRGSGGLGIYGDSGSNQNGHLTLHPTGSAVYTNIYFYNAAGNSYASIIGHAGGTLFFTGGTNGPLRHRVSGTGFHSFQEGNTERVRITAAGDLLFGAHGSRIFDDSSGTNVVVDIYGGTTAGKRGILALGGRTGDDNADIGTIQFLNENNANATSSSHVQSKLVASIDAKSETTTSNSGANSGSHLIFSTKAENAALTERLRITSTGEVKIPTGSNSTNRLTFGGGINIYHDGNMKFENGTGYLKLQSNNAVYIDGSEIYFRNAGGTNRMIIQSTGIVKVESNDSSGLSAHLVVNNSESNSGLSIMGSGSSFSSGGWAAVTDAGIIRSSANSSNGLVLQAASGDLRFYAGGNPPAERFRLANDGTPTFYSPAVAWHEGPAVLEASNGYAEIFFRSTGSTHGTSVTGTWSIGKLAGADGFAVLKNGMSGGGAVRQDAPLSISNAGDITIGKNLSIPQKPGFFAYMNGGNQTTNGNNIIPFDQTHFNTGGHFKTSGTNAYKFVCPVAGIYHFSGAIWMKNSGTGAHARWQIRKNDVIQCQAGWHQNANNSDFYDHSAPACITIYCDAGDRVHAHADYTIQYWRGGSSHPHTYFSGHFVG